MKKEENMAKRSWWLKLLLQIVLVDLLVCLGVLSWSWLAGDFNWISLSNRFFLGGVLTILVGAGSGLGNWENRGDWQQMYARSAGPASLTERNRQMMAEILQVDSFMFLMIPAGLISILVAVLLGQFA
jgi:hypothetical protein